MKATTKKVLFLLFSGFLFLASCSEAERELSTEVYLAPTGGKYTFVRWSKPVQASLLHPSSEPQADRYVLALPLAEIDPASEEGDMAFVYCEQGQLLHRAMGQSEGSDAEGYFAPYLVREGQVVDYRSPQLAYRVAMLESTEGEWFFALTNNQLSRRQAAKELAAYGVKTAIDFGLTRKAGWYRYAKAAFELRRGRQNAVAVLALSE